jgi:hypothetical protein
MALRATLRHESLRISCQKSVIQSERSESKDLVLLFGKLTFNRAPDSPHRVLTGMNKLRQHSPRRGAVKNGYFLLVHEGLLTRLTALRRG